MWPDSFVFSFFFLFVFGDAPPHRQPIEVSASERSVTAECSAIVRRLVCALLLLLLRCGVGRIDRERIRLTESAAPSLSVRPLHQPSVTTRSSPLALQHRIGRALTHWKSKRARTTLEQQSPCTTVEATARERQSRPQRQRRQRQSARRDRVTNRPLRAISANSHR